MKSKRIVYFDENLQEKGSIRRESTSKNNLSISKGIRETSAHKHQKTPSGRIAGMDKSSQKIRILITKDGFIFERKYMIYDIQCTLTKQDKPDPLGQKTKRKGQEGQEECPTQRTQEDFLFLNLETNSFAVTKGMVRHNFSIERDNSNYIQVRAAGYAVDNIIISNKKIEFVLLEGIESFDDQDITIIEPIKQIEESQSIRQEKVRNYFLRMNGNGQTRKASKSLNICWLNEPSVDNAESGYKIVSKKNEIQQSSTLNGQSINNFFQIGKDVVQRESSKNKRISSNAINDGNKTGRESVQKGTLNELMKMNKEKEGPIKTKPSSRKFLNDSGLSYGMLGKMGKENSKKEDAYGLEQLNKRSRTKTVQNDEARKIVESLDPDPKSMDSEPSRYGMGKKLN